MSMTEKKTEYFWWNEIIYSIKMEYQKIINLLDNTPNQATKFRTNKWVEIDDGACGICIYTCQWDYCTCNTKSK